MRRVCLRPWLLTICNRVSGNRTSKSRRRGKTRSKKGCAACRTEQRKSMKERFDGVVDHLLNGGIFLQQAIEILEKSMIQGALERTNGNQCAASKALGIHRNTLQRKMAEYGLIALRNRARRKPAARAGQKPKYKTAAA